MIIKGTSCKGASRLAAHLLRTDTNERAEVREIRGVAADTLKDALKEIETVSTGTRSTKPLYHASINTRADERLTDEQRTHAIDTLEEKLGLTGQPRVVVVHEKEGREHCHIVWSRVDLDRMATISDSHNYRKHEEVARSLEREFGHERVQGAHAERDGQDRPDRTPSHSEMLQAQRTGIPAKEAKEFMTGIWNDTKTGKEFQTALAEQGWTLARGDRRDFVAIDPRGGTHSIARRIEGARVIDIRQRFSDIDARKLPSVIEAKQLQQNQDPRVALRQRLGVQSGATRQKPKERVATQPRTQRAPLGVRAAGSVAGRIGGSLFSALMGESPAPSPRTKSKEPEAVDNSQAQLRQELMRQLSRDVPPEQQRDAEIEVRQKQDRDRGRGR